MSFTGLDGFKQVKRVLEPTIAGASKSWKIARHRASFLTRLPFRQEDGVGSEKWKLRKVERVCRADEFPRVKQVPAKAGTSLGDVAAGGNPIHNCGEEVIGVAGSRRNGPLLGNILQVLFPQDFAISYMLAHSGIVQNRPGLN